MPCLVPWSICSKSVDKSVIVSSHAKLITCPIELKPLRGNDRHV
ncbi:hypothetical protein VL20_5282 [Microcystis panniformis FACHB-1757]|uniref:Uncharacterized protein n=1 Tax=Microcystis panniformis FACHB-1757 TaxID=1638788 RepID=A0A0K1S7M7_9CHRO|nr:hypothetical protein VL20_5282 [Microcystis panniformis FACHB-1757]